MDNKKTNTQEKRLDYLINVFKNESSTYRNIEIADVIDEKRKLLRSLMNVRMPGKIDDKTLEVQNEYLQELIKENGIVSINEIPIVKNIMSVWQGDITRLKVDAIVNAANSQMLGCFIPMHTCIDNCIHTFAGIQLREECYNQMKKLKDKFGSRYEQPTAIPLVTDAYNLPSKKVVHIVGPIVNHRLTSRLKLQLAECYKNVLDICKENEIKSIAFCCISTGVFNFPKEEAAKIAVKTVKDWLMKNEGELDRVIFNVFKKEDKEYYEKLL